MLRICKALLLFRVNNQISTTRTYPSEQYALEGRKHISLSADSRLKVGYKTTFLITIWSNIHNQGIPDVYAWSDTTHFLNPLDIKELQRGIQVSLVTSSVHTEEWVFQGI